MNCNNFIVNANLFKLNKNKYRRSRVHGMMVMQTTMTSHWSLTGGGDSANRSSRLEPGVLNGSMTSQPIKDGKKTKSPNSHMYGRLINAVKNFNIVRRDVESSCRRLLRLYRANPLAVATVSSSVGRSVGWSCKSLQLAQFLRN